MGKLPAEDRLDLQRLQEGLSGVVAMDDRWIDTVVNIVKFKPHLLKSMVKGRGEMIGSCAGHFKFLCTTFVDINLILLQATCPISRPRDS